MASSGPCTFAQLQEAVADEERNKAELRDLENQLQEVIRKEKAAYDAVMAATRLRMRLFAAAHATAAAQAAASRRRMRKLADAPQPIENPDDLNRKNRERARFQAAWILEDEGRPLLAIELAKRIGCPARAIRNYLDGDPRFRIDHLAVKGGKRDAVRVWLTDEQCTSATKKGSCIHEHEAPRQDGRPHQSAPDHARDDGGHHPGT